MDLRGYDNGRQPDFQRGPDMSLYLARAYAWLCNGLVCVGLWLAHLGGWAPTPPCARPHLPSDALMDVARAVVANVEKLMPDAPSEVKRREALRSLLNVAPAGERDLNLLIELALQ